MQAVFKVRDAREAENQLLNHDVYNLDFVTFWARRPRVWTFGAKSWNLLWRSLIKEPKIYLWNWALIEDVGAQLENFVASHLYKAVQFWTDCGLGDYGLFYLRDKDKRAVDFLVTKNKKPWFLVETKASGQQGISRWLYYYQEKLKAPHAFQIGFDLPYIDQDCFSTNEPLIVPAKTFLSQLI